MNMNYSEEEIDRGDYLHDQRRDAKAEQAMSTNNNEREVILYALTFLHSNMSADSEVAEDMMDFMSPDAIIEDEIVSAIESFSKANPPNQH